MAVPGQPREAGDWLLGHALGAGSFAKVWHATHRGSGQVAAVKEVQLDKLSKKLQESLASEVAVLRRTQHANIVGLQDIIRDGSRLFLVLEYCGGGDLGAYLRRYRHVSEATARYFLLHLAEGLKELRRHNVIHRDLKPQNLLLSDGGCSPCLKIADFGFARPLSGPQGLAETLCGSPLYMAPEILSANKYDAKADLWSVGAILYELLVGRPPYNGANHIQLLHNIQASEARLPEHVAARLSPPCRGLLARLLQRNPVERLSFDEFFGHAFLSRGDAGPCAGVPPSQPGQAQQQQQQQQAASAGLPPAMRQAAAAAAAAAHTGGGAAARLHRASIAASQPQGQHAGTQQAAHAAGQPTHGTLLPAHHQQQHQAQHAQQQQAWHQQPPVQPLPQAPPPHAAGLVAQPVRHHPLAPEPGAARRVAAGAAGAAAAEELSDSMEGDYVVVYNPSHSSSQRTRSSNSNSSSNAGSSGLADPKAAAVLQASTTPVRMAWAGATAAGAAATPEQQLYQQHRQQALAQAQAPHAAALPQRAFGLAVSAQQQQQQRQQLGHSTAALAPQSQPGSSVLQASAALQATAPQRVQLLVQVVRSVVVLLTRHEAGGAKDAAAAAGAAASQQDEQLALLLLALQLVQALCFPGEQDGQDAEAGDAGAAPGGSVASLLAAASQADLEQLMCGAVELLRLAKSLPALDGDSAAFDAHSADGAGARLAASLLARPLPDPAGVLYHAALDSCRAAAVEEAMGSWHGAMQGYSLAADLLLFLAQDWPQLPAAANPGLAPAERAGLRQLYAAAAARLAAVVAQAPPAPAASAAQCWRGSAAAAGDVWRLGHAA